MIVTLVGCRGRLSYGQTGFLKQFGCPSSSVTGLRDCRGSLCARGLFKAPPRTSLQLETPCPRGAASPRTPFKVSQPSPAARQLLLAQLFGVSTAFLEDFNSTPPDSDQCLGRAESKRRDPGLSLTGTGEVSALDGVARAGVHPARGLGLVAAKDKEWGCQHPRGPREPLPISGEGSLQHRGLFQPKGGDFRERGEQHPSGWDSGEPQRERSGGKGEMTVCDRKAARGRGLQWGVPLVPSPD